MRAARAFHWTDLHGVNLRLGTARYVSRLCGSQQNKGNPPPVGSHQSMGRTLMLR